MKNKSIASAEKNKIKTDLLDQLIPKYDFGRFCSDVEICTNPNKGKILPLIKLLEIEINRLNGQVQKQLNRLDYIGTID